MKYIIIVGIINTLNIYGMQDTVITIHEESHSQEISHHTSPHLSIAEYLGSESFKREIEIMQSDKVIECDVADIHKVIHELEEEKKKEDAYCLKKKIALIAGGFTVGASLIAGTVALIITYVD